MVNLISHVPGEYLQFQVTKKLISNFSSGLDFGEKTIEKSGSGKVRKTQACLVFIYFLPETVKISIVGYSYPIPTFDSGHFELLSPSKLPLS